MLYFNIKNYVGRIAITYASNWGGRGWTLNLFIRRGCWLWGYDPNETDGWGTFGCGPFFQICWDNGL